jgi:hypothetical protein
MNRIQRCVAVLAALAGALCAFAAAVPAALATLPPPDPGPPGSVPAPVIHTIVADGMPGWQIALTAAGAAVLAAVVAVLADRAWVARRQVSAPARLEHDQDLHLQGKS